MFDLERAIREWKRTMRRNPSIDDGDLAELERYLRDKVEDLTGRGMSPEDAFGKAEEEFRRAAGLDAAYNHARSILPRGRFPWKPERFSPGRFFYHLRIALRRLRFQKSYALINIGGLALGLACALLIFLWARDEWGYDRFQTRGDRIYRVVFSSSDDGDRKPTNANGSFGVGPALKKDFPEVLEAVRIKKASQNSKRYVGYGDKKFYESRFFFAEPALLTVFDFPLVSGEASSALKDPGTIVLTEAMAEKYFGDEDPMGKILESDPYNTGTPMLFRVTGVAKNVPLKSHIHFDFLASYASLQEDTRSFSGYAQHYTYVLLKDAGSAAALEPRLLEFLQRNWRKDPWYTISLQPLLDIHLRSGLRSEIEPGGNILSLYIFSAIALAVLLIACVNYMNLATARSARRAKEIGIRKAVGAPKSRLVRQLLGESLFLSLISTCAAVLIIMILLPWFNRLAGKEISVGSLADPVFLLAAAAVTLIVGIVSGAYPAFYLSALRPIPALKAKTGQGSSGVFLRRALVVFQFTLSIGIICATLVVRAQMRHIQSRDIGYDREQILVIPLNKEVRRGFEAFRNELLANPVIENAATSSYVPTAGSAHYNLDFEGGNTGITQVLYLIDREFFATYGLRLVAGRTIERPFSEGEPAEIVISAESAREAGYASPQEAIGKGVDLEGLKGTIIGVVKDINIYSLRRPAYPIVYLAGPVSRHDYLSVRFRAKSAPEALAHLRKTWRMMVQTIPLDYAFLDESFGFLHLSEKRMRDIFSVFSLMAVAIACLGLLGLASYTAEQRTKEIGIRKVMGASASGIAVRLSKDFLKWVALANLFAWPAAYFIMQGWLREFAYRIKFGWWIFPVSAALALAMAILTIGWQTLRAARANPVESLRYE